MRTLALTQRVRAVGLQSPSHSNVLTRPLRRNLSLWHPPKFENDKPVRIASSLRGGLLYWNFERVQG